MKRLSRRGFITSTAGAVGMAAFAGRTQPSVRQPWKTRYIAAYDTESPSCLRACEKIVEVHRRMAMPATFFILARTLLAHRQEYRELLDDPLFEIASHTYDHQMLRNHDFCGPAASPEQIRKEVVVSKLVIEEVFQKPCVGLRPGCSFPDGLRGAPEVLALVQEGGYAYVSSLLWGPDYSMPALLNQPFSYSADGFADVWELPGHGWHENLLKDNNQWGPRRLALWPAPMPEAVPGDFVRTPEDEFAVNRVFLDKAEAERLAFVSLIWHPWSLHGFDPEMRMLELTFGHARSKGLQPSTYGELFQALVADGPEESDALGPRS
jgi:hypothetical protein